MEGGLVGASGSVGPETSLRLEQAAPKTNYLPNLSASFGPRRRTPRRAAVGLCVVCMFALLRSLHEESPTLASGPVGLRLRLGLSGSTCVWARRSFADLLPEEEDWVEYFMRLLESCTSCLLLVLGLAC